MSDPKTPSLPHGRLCVPKQYKPRDNVPDAYTRYMHWQALLCVARLYPERAAKDPEVMAAVQELYTDSDTDSEAEGPESSPAAASE